MKSECDWCGKEIDVQVFSKTETTDSKAIIAYCGKKCKLEADKNQSEIDGWNVSWSEY